MPEVIQWTERWLRQRGLADAFVSPTAQLVVVAGVLLLAVAANFAAKRILLRVIKSFIRKTETTWDDVFVDNRVFDRLSHLAPAMVIYVAAPVAFPHTEELQGAVRSVCLAYMAIVVAIVFDGFLDAIAHIYQTFEVAKHRPIRAYVQVVKVLVFVVTAILVISFITNRSPWAFLSGLAGLTAVILLVFKDTLLGLVASIQLTANNMVRVGDWIEVPKHGVDGDVIEVSLNTIKVQNWNKTISTVPTYALVADSFKNWRGMNESGGRRIKRALYIDMNSVKFCDDNLLDRFSRMALLGDYLASRRAEVEAHNQSSGADTSVPANRRRLTNLGTFRAYVEAYLRAHPKIHRDMTFLVRQLPPGPDGLGLEIYVFSSDQVWANYESIQADIFDHLLAVLPEFELRVFQHPGGADLTRWMEAAARG